MLSDMVAWPTVDGRRRETKWAREPGTYCGLLFLYSTRTGEPLAIMPDGIAQHLRVGAGAGLGTKRLSRADSQRVGIMGSGGMARSYLDAFMAIRPIRHVSVFSPNAVHREQYAVEMAARHGIDVRAVDRPEDAVRGADIVALVASSVEPVFDPAWLEPGMHVVDVTQPSTPAGFADKVDIAIWHGYPTPRIEQLPPGAMYARGGFLSWVAGTPEETAIIPRGSAPDPAAMPTLADLIGGRTPGRTSPEQTTFFHNVGMFGSQFVAVAGAAYENALRAGVGREIPTDWFLENVRD
jgi:ornithine cyclodeaminase/alanine dehydrogenase-like protein (mu-crystallin family)